MTNSPLNYEYTTHVCVHECGRSLAEDKSKVVFSLLVVPQVFETQSFQEAQQTLIVYCELSPWKTHKTCCYKYKSWREYPTLTGNILFSDLRISLTICHINLSMSILNLVNDFSYFCCSQVEFVPHPEFSACFQSGLCVYQWPCSRSRCTSSPGQDTEPHKSSTRGILMDKTELKKSFLSLKDIIIIKSSVLKKSLWYP